MPTTEELPDVMDVLLQLGRFSMLVIAVWVAIMLFTSFMDRHPRSKQSSDDDSRD